MFTQSTPLWSAEVEVEITTQFEHSDSHRNYHLIHPDYPGVDSSGARYESIGEQIFYALAGGHLNAFRNEGLTEAMTLAEVNNLIGDWDTIATYDPVSLEGTYEPVLVCPNPDDFDLINLHLTVGYQADGSINQTIRCGSLMSCRYDPNGIERSGGERIYFPLTVVNEPINLNAANWLIIDEHSVNIPWSDFKLHANNQLTCLGMMEKAFDRFMSGDAEDSFVSVDGHFRPIVAAERAQIRSRTDSIITYMLPDYSEHLEVVEITNNPEDITQLRLLFLLAWDEEQHGLTILPIGYASMRAILDRDLGHLYDLPVFYHRPAEYKVLTDQF